MIELRVAESDADLELWRQVRLTVLPYEPCAPVAELRRTATPGSLFVLAFRDGELAGSGLTGRSEIGGSFVAPRVLPEHRRRGVGEALLSALAGHAHSLGFELARAKADDPGSFAFAERFGFAEVGREVEFVREVGAREPAPEGFQIVSLAERPELHMRAYEEVAVESFLDMPTAGPISITAEDWRREWLDWPEASFVALDGDEVIGCVGLLRDPDHPDRAAHSLTAVRRDHRRGGVGRALKQQTIAWASANGIRELATWTQSGNEAMQGLNRSLGYVVRNTSISVARVLPLA